MIRPVAKQKSATEPPRGSSHANRLDCASAAISNWTGLPVFPRDCGSVPNVQTTDQITELELDKVKANRLAVDRQLEQRLVSDAFFAT